MKSISEYSVKKPISIIMMALIVIVLGVFSLSKMSLSLFPDVNLPYAVVVTTYTGATPEEVEVEITKKVESSVSGITNFDSITSRSSEHYAMSMITFVDGTNMDTVFLDIRESLDQINFKEGVSSPMIMRISPDMLPVMTLTISRDYGSEVSDEEALIATTKWLEEEVQQKLNQTEGVADVSVSGTADTVLKLTLNETALQELSLSNEQVLDKINRSNIEGLIGFSLDTDGIQMLYIGNKVEGLANLKEVPIFYDDVNNKVYTLAELAEIELINNDDASYSKINGKLGVIISIQKQSEYGITEVVKAINTTLEEIVQNEEEYPVSYQSILDQGEYINLAISTIVENILIGAALAIVVLLIFLRNFKATAIVAVSMPISIVGTFALMYFTGVTLNVISMGGLALGVGMLVDNSIVVIENIYRMLSEGASKKEAAIYGTKQVVSAITASTLTTVAVFVPMFFMEGMISDVFRSMSLTVIYSLIASLLVAITVVPTASSHILKEKREYNQSKFGEKIFHVYEKTLGFTLKHKVLTILLVVTLFVGSGLLAYSRGFTLMPKTDEGSISVTLTVDKKTEFIDLSKIADATTEKIMEEIGDLDVVSTEIGSSGMMSSIMGGFGVGNSVTYEISLKQDRELSTAENLSIVRNIFTEFDYKVIKEEEEIEINVLEIEISEASSINMVFGSQGIVIEVKGQDLQDMKTVAQKIATLMYDTEGLEKVDDGISVGEPQLRVVVDKTKALKQGITSQDVKDSINLFYTSLGISSIVTSSTGVFYTVDGVEYEITAEATGITGATGIDYQMFLGMIALFDEGMLNALNEAYEKGEISPYAINPFLASETIDLPGVFNPENPQGFIYVNPMLEYKVENGVYTFQEANQNIMTIPGEKPTVVVTYTPHEGYAMLSSAAKGTVYSENATNPTEVVQEDGFATITTDGKNRVISVTAKYTEGVNKTAVAKVVSDRVNDYLESDDFQKQYNGIKVVFSGENETTMLAIEDLIYACLVGILLVYMIMAIQFQSLKYPLIVLSVIPLSFTGGFLACYLVGIELSIVAIIGLIMLVGIVVNNGIVLIDYINVLIEEGKPIKEAIISASKTRIRPIFMTSITTIFGVLPLAIGLGQGAEIMQPLAIAVVGGLTYATLLTLIVVPTIYGLSNNKKMKKELLENEGNER
ncbi:MAG: efflux RND transporter permease subunit [Bacilli bacterium]|nr:efflux RND transporter permease subunit [Bacilli bacterium]